MKASLNSAITDLSPPPIPFVQRAAQRYDRRMGPLLDLSQAVPDFVPPTDFLAWLSQAAADPDYLGYGDIEGEAPLRQAYAGHVSALYQAAISPDEIHITSGCNQAFVAAALATTAPGQKILLVTPYYFNHETTLAMLGIGVGYCAARTENDFMPTLDDIEAAIDDDIRAVAIVSPNNPTGAVYAPAHLNAIAALVERLGRWLIIDETYRDFRPDTTAPHAIFSTPAWRQNTIGLYSFSKAFCIPGHRLGAITAPANIIAEIAKIIDNVQICAPRAPQHAVATALPALGAWRERNRKEISDRRQALLATMATVPDWTIDSIGAYFAYVRHPFSDRTAETVARALAEQAGIVTLPGSFFGAGQEHYLRIAFANVGINQVNDMAERLTRLGENVNR